MLISQVAQEALAHATQSESMANYAAIFSGFAEKGIEEAEIQPRVNVFTFYAWKALGRSVRKGEHGVKIGTWVPMTKKNADGEAQPIGRKPRMTTVFHVSQTDPINGFESDSNADTGVNAEVEPAPIPEERAPTHHTRMRPVVTEQYYSDQFTAM